MHYALTLFYFRVFAAFYNESFNGSRYSANRYYVFGPAEEVFCNQTVPPGLLNAVPPGECGINGFSVPANVFGVTSYEKDGTITGLLANGLYGM